MRFPREPKAGSVRHQLMLALAEVERLKAIEKSGNGRRRGKNEQALVIPQDDAGRAAYWRGRAKSAEGQIAGITEALLSEGSAREVAVKAAWEMNELQGIIMEWVRVRNQQRIFAENELEKANAEIGHLKQKIASMREMF